MTSKTPVSDTRVPPARKPRTIPAEKLRWVCPKSYLSFRTTAEIAPAKEIIGQKKAVEALRLGVELYSPGYNIFVCGLSGTGKMTTVEAMLEQIKPRSAPPRDRCYVNNFKNPHRPTLITLSKGQGMQFKRDMELFVDFLQKHIPLHLDAEDFQKKRDQVGKELEEKGKSMFLEFEAHAGKQGFALAQVQTGMITRPDLLPLVDEKPMTIQEFEKKAREEDEIPKSARQVLNRYTKLRAELDAILRESQRLSRELMTRIGDLERRTVRTLIKPLLDELLEKYDNDTITSYLSHLMDDVVEHLDRFKEKEGDGAGASVPPWVRPRDQFLPYRVNVVLDCSDNGGCPVIIETTPTFNNIFGHVEKVPDETGHLSTDFTRIKAGSLLLADGGYLVFNAVDAITETGVWKALKRALTYNLLEIQGVESVFGVLSTPLKPEPIDLNVKVILIGDSHLYHYLYRADEDFKQIFKVKVDFDSTMKLSKTGLRQFSTVISKVCREEKLKPLNSGAVAALAEESVRISGMREKMSTRFSQIADLIREADYWSTGSRVTGRRHIEKAITKQEERNNLVELRMQEYIERGTLLIGTRGSVVGQLNGLSVYDLGNHRFGRPTRITASTSFGKAGIINIEREAKLSGKTHDKGVLILGGYLRNRYAQQVPLTLSASLCFEQSYSGVDGDSASSTEIYAVLSSLSGLPLRQDIAVTGSVNQKGEIQPIGGVNEKIEGFYEVCRSQGLTGGQGVMIPGRNVKDLMLRQDVVEAVASGRFQLYAVDSIDQGIEILTGVSAGRENRRGIFPKGTVNRLVMERLKELGNPKDAKNEQKTDKTRDENKKKV